VGDRGAEEEGVEFHYLAAPVSVKADGKKAVALVCNKMRLGEPDKSGRRRPEPIPGSEFEIPLTASSQLSPARLRTSISSRA